MTVHPLLERQLAKHLGVFPSDDVRLRAFLADVDAAYRTNDEDRTLLERSIDLASAELLEQNERLARDLESIQRLELELRQADKLRAVGQLASGIAHEINTPIQFVGSSVGFIGEAATELVSLGRAAGALCGALDAQGIDVPEASVVRAALEAADLETLAPDLERAGLHATEGLSRVAQIVQAMRRFGRPDQREKVLSDVNRCVLDTLTVAANELKHVARVVTELGELPLVFCYPNELNQVLLNLVVNAAHAVAERVRPDEMGKIVVRSTSVPGAVQIAVTDDGVGIKPEDAPRIFEPFFTTKPVGRGTGQGLAISRSIVQDKHGGTLTFQSRAGEGSTFIVTLPSAGIDRKGVQ